MNQFLYGDENYLIKQRYYKHGLVYYTLAEEILNSVSHAIGGALGIAALVVFYLLANNVYEKAAAIISGIFIALPYVNSAVYHGLTDLKLKSVWRKIDHSSICFIIIGCATPMILCLSPSTYNFVAMGIALLVSIINITGCGISLKKFSKIALCLDFVVAFLFTGAYVLQKNFIPLSAKICYITGAAVCLLAMIAYAIRKKYVHTLFHVMMLLGTVIFLAAGYVIYTAS
ncbi:MAG: hemolysin III family protein [Christensenellales bacterium]